MVKRLMITIFLLFLSACQVTAGKPAMDAQANIETTQTQALKPSATITPTLMPTLTPTPTLKHTLEHQAAIETLLATNGNCDLPCFWGITPMQTTKAEMLEKLSGIASIQQEIPNGIRLFFSLVFHDTYQKKGQVYVLEEATDIPVTFSWSESELIDSIIVGFPPPICAFTPKKIVTMLGQPDEIWVYRDIDSWNYFRVYFYYEKFGLKIDWSIGRQSVTSDPYPEDSVFMPAVDLSMRIKPSMQGSTFQEYYSAEYTPLMEIYPGILSDGSGYIYLQLEDVSSMNVASVMEQLQENDSFFLAFDEDAWLDGLFGEDENKP